MGIAGSILMRMHGSGMHAMGSEAVSGRSEGDWQGDGMNALRGRSKGPCGAQRAPSGQPETALNHAATKKRAQMNELCEDGGGYFG